jgi:acylphosphatase
MKRAHIIISGIVQGVGFRYHARSEAFQLGLGGWVRNLPDGRVEAVAEGDDGSVDAFVKWCRTGPPSSVVKGVEVEMGDPGGEAGFAVRH